MCSPRTLKASCGWTGEGDARSLWEQWGEGVPNELGVVGCRRFLAADDGRKVFLYQCRAALVLITEVWSAVDDRGMPTLSVSMGKGWGMVLKHLGLAFPRH